MSSSEATEAKRQKVEGEPEAASETPENGKISSADNGKARVEDGAKALEAFRVVKILNHLRDKHCLFLLAEHKETKEDAVIKLEKTAFEEDLELLNQFCSPSLETRLVFRNDIYATLGATPLDQELVRRAAAFKVATIHPATPNHIVKYTSQEIYIVNETPEAYRTITLPYLESSAFEHKWIHNILDHKKETERIVIEDPDEEKGFILLPDMKWDGRQLTDLYVSAIVRRRDIKSMRELRGHHLPLLKNVMDKSLKAIEEKYGVKSSKIVAYFHYQPSYYHLHVHFTHVAFEAPGRDATGAHLVRTVMNNLEQDGDHYSKATIPFKVKHESDLRRRYEDAGFI